MVQVRQLRDKRKVEAETVGWLIQLRALKRQVARLLALESDLSSNQALPGMLLPTIRACGFVCLSHRPRILLSLGSSKSSGLRRCHQMSLSVRISGWKDIRRCVEDVCFVYRVLDQPLCIRFLGTPFVVIVAQNIEDVRASGNTALSSPCWDLLATMRRVVNYHSSWARQQQVELFDASGIWM
ncbi:putative WRKY transcription factor 3-like [Dorcoceras hygrometricum]|uniref:Putative WRKY transcription factor 3-like n=1 Tax=Dorcoceras hygrometricum TaxID=472368 RepID=A0A2Z7D321_9LAMI|nr:putative WRKY transcription factor 3-like [Dorcoceras hygrometricum]